MKPFADAPGGEPLPGFTRSLTQAVGSSGGVHVADQADTM